MQEQFTVEYFIDKFERIPEEKWCTDLYNGHEDTHCALGHCRISRIGGGEADMLVNIFGSQNKVININDGKDDNYPQPTPKQRILAALYDIKAQGAVEEAKKIIENYKNKEHEKSHLQRTV